MNFRKKYVIVCPNFEKKFLIGVFLMANNYVQVSSIIHDYTNYSPENIKRELDMLSERGLSSEITEKYSKFLETYPDEFSVLYRVSQQSLSSDMDLKYEMVEVPYRRPEIACEEYDVAGKTKQLELQCTFEDGTTFGLSALKTSTEPQQMQGQISFSEEMLRNLNDEKLKQIFEFCHRYGFSTFGLSLPMNGGVIDVDAKLKELFERYQAQELQNVTDQPGAPKPSEELETDQSEHTQDETSKYYTTLTDDVTYAPTAPTGATFDEEVLNIENFLRKDLHKREYRSYWKHTKRINGDLAYVFSVYDKENPDNYLNDGKPDPKNHKVHIPTYSYRFYVSYSKNRFHFGYATPGGKPFDASMAGDFIGEIKKTGVTHLNLSSVPNCDKVTLMIACAEKGIVPKGVKITRDKAEKMLNAAKAKLSKQELSAFELRLMEQWEANYAAKGDTLSVSDQAYIQQCKNESVDLLRQQKNEFSAANLNRDFVNFKNAYLNELKPLVEQKIEEGSRDSERGAAITMAGMQTLREVFDLYIGNENEPELDSTIGSRIENKYARLEKGLQKRLDSLNNQEQKLLNSMPRNDEEKKRVYEEELKELREKKRQTQEQMNDIRNEKNALIHKIDVSKPIKALSNEDFKAMYDILYPLQEKRMEQRIIQAFRDDDNARAHRADDVIIGGVIFPTVKGSVNHINTVLYNNNLEKLELPLEHAGLSFKRPTEMSWGITQIENERKKAQKPQEPAQAAPAPTPVSRDR